MKLHETHKKYKRQLSSVCRDGEDIAYRKALGWNTSTSCLVFFKIMYLNYESLERHGNSKETQKQKNKIVVSWQLAITEEQVAKLERTKSKRTF